MTDSIDDITDSDLWALVTEADRTSSRLEEMSSCIDEESEEALAMEAARSESLCCQLSGRVASVNYDGLYEIVELALSEEFRKYYFVCTFICEKKTCNLQ